MSQTHATSSGGWPPQVRIRTENGIREVDNIEPKPWVAGLMLNEFRKLEPKLSITPCETSDQGPAIHVWGHLPVGSWVLDISWVLPCDPPTQQVQKALNAIIRTRLELTPSQIKAMREDQKLTGAEAAALVHVDPRTWRKWEQGERHMPPTAVDLFFSRIDFLNET